MPPSKDAFEKPSEPKNVRQRVTDSSAIQDEEQVAKYIDWLYSAIVAYSQNARRTTLLLLTLVAAFELVNGPGGTQISFGSFQIHKGSIVLVFLPALVSYLYLQVMIITVKGDDMQAAFDASFTQWWPNGRLNDLDEFILPQTPLYWNTTAPVSIGNNANHRRIKVEMIVSAIFTIIIVVGILLFEGQAYYVLYSSHVARYYWFGSLSIEVFSATFS